MAKSKPWATEPAHLKRYLKSVHCVPHELIQDLKLMRQLDDKSHAIISDIHDMAKKCLERPKNKRGRPPRASKESTNQIEKLRKHCIMCLDTKVQLATTLYDTIDHRIRRLDQDISLFEAELTSGGNVIVDRGRARSGKRAKSQNNISRAKRARMSELEADKNVDPFEPVYCTCRRVAFGEMISCDNPNCRVEWFHFACVGLTEKTRPKTTWFCSDCNNLRRRGLLRGIPKKRGRQRASSVIY